MPKQKSNALVVYSGEAAPRAEQSSKAEILREVKALLAKAVENLKKQMGNQVKVPSNSGGIPPYARIMANPLEAPLATRPDYNTIQTNIYRLMDVYDVVSTSTGVAMAAFGGGLTGANFIAPSFTGTALTSLGTSSASQYYTSLNTDNVLFRTVLFVVQWMPTANENVAQGIVHLGFYAGTNIGSSITVGEVSTFMDDSNGILGQADETAVIISRPYLPPSLSAMTSTFGANFPNVVFAASGLPASISVGKLMITRIVECVPLSGNIPSMTARRSPSDPLAMACGDNIMGPGSSYAVGENCYAKVVKAGLARATASVQDLENWTGATAMSRTLRSTAAAA